MGRIKIKVLSLFCLILLSFLFFKIEVGEKKVLRDFSSTSPFSSKRRGKGTTVSLPHRGPHRGPAEDSKSSSAKRQRRQQHSLFKRGNRALIGSQSERERFSSEDVDLEFENQINSRWKDELSQELLRFQPKGAQVFIEHEHALIQVKRGKGRYLEQVTIVYRLPTGGRRNSFHALVDSQSGRVVRTWGRTIHEERIRFRPSP